MNQAIRELEQGIEEFLAANTDVALPARKMIDPLLDLWSLTVRVDPLAAAPLESLMTAFVHRDLTTPKELAEALNEVLHAVTPSQPARV